ncbi:unnamed protein product [Allacma fusca]|uniref:Uncharacterized protein n=1 Tax=Allacma fusca TaxID=39272 RepID=A0A8J2K2R5_9HEXA|nr:unnamed protein product [Allacma fusca]
MTNPGTILAGTILVQAIFSHANILGGSIHQLSAAEDVKRTGYIYTCRFDPNQKYSVTRFVVMNPPRGSA